MNQEEYSKNRTFIGDCQALLDELPECTGDTARLAMRLSRAVNRLEEIVQSSQQQFKRGKPEARFSPLEIERLNNP